jgi:alpha-N-arabinofuranosidase
VPLTVSIEGSDGKTVYAQAEGGRINGEWKRYSVTLTTGANVKPTADARLVIATERPGTVWFNQVSLFPPTYKDRPNGNRADLMQKLVDMKPAFLRFPGGNYLEGETVATRFKWKETLGAIDQRPGHRGTWGYRSSDGMGLLEFLLNGART